MKTWGSRIKWVGAAIALSVILLCCAVFSFVFLDNEKNASAEHSTASSERVEANESAGQLESVTYAPKAGQLVTYYELDGTNNESAWNQAIQTSINGNGLLVTVRLTANWTGSDFGTGVGFYKCNVAGHTIIQIPNKANILLDLNGYDIVHIGFPAYTDDGVVCYIPGGGKLEVMGNGRISGGSRGSNVTSGGGAFLLYAGASLVLSGGTITGNEGSNGGAVFCKGANLTVDGAIISGNKAKDKGGAIYATDGSTVRIKSGTIAENQADVGGGIYVDNSSTLSVSGGYIMGNSSFGNNQTSIAESGGGGVTVKKSTFTMDGGTISNNIVTKGKGGGVFFFDDSTFTLNGGIISNNSASGNTSSVGGGVRGDDSTFYMYGGTITQNTVAGSSADAGGIGMWGCTFEMYGGTISENRALTDSGGWSGALEIWHCTVTMYDGKMINNQTNGNGGAITVYDSSTFTMYGGTISNNRCLGVGGGIVAQNGGELFFYGGNITGNTADSAGGGVSSWKDITIGSKQVTKNGKTYGGGFKCYDNIGANVKDNIHLVSNAKIIVEGSLMAAGNATSVGITPATAPTATAPITFIDSYNATTAGGLVSTFFYSDKSEYKIQGTTSGQIALGTAATAIVWTYSSSIDQGASWQSSTLNVKEYSQTYTGNWFRIIASAGTVTTKTTGTLLTGGTAPNTYQYFKDVGTYTFIVNDAGYTNNIITVKVVPRAVTISWSEQDLYYNAGKTQYPAAVLGGIVTGDDCKLTVNSATAGIDAGTYTVTAGLTGAQVKNYELPSDGSYIKTYSILPRKLSKPYINGGLIYDGSALQVIGGFDPTGMTISYDSTSPTITNYVYGVSAGTYNATIQLLDPKNFRWEDNTTSIVYLSSIVNKVVLSVSGITLTAKEYDGTSKTTLDVDSLSVLGVVSKDHGADGKIDKNRIWIVPVDYDTGLPSATGEIDLGGSTAGKYSKKITLQMTGSMKDNYTLLSDVYECITYITRATIKVTGGITVATNSDGLKGKVYDGNTTVNFDTSNAVIVYSANGKACSGVTVDAYGGYTSVNAGTSVTALIWSLKLGGTLAENYELDVAASLTHLNDGTITGEIKKKDVTAVVTAGDCVYGSVPNVTYAVTGAVAGEDIKLALTYLNGTDSTTVLKTAGTYAITAALTTEFAVNYNLTSVAPNGGAAGDPVEVEITKAPLTITVYDAEAAYGAGKVNNGAFVTGLVWSDTRASLSIADGDLTFTYGDFDTDSGAVGTYVLSIDTTALSLANYTVTVVDGEFAVGLKQLNVTITVTNGIYGGTGSDAAAVTAAADDNGTAVSVTIKYTYNGTSYDGTVYTNSTTIPVKPGEYEVIATVDTASGYTGRATSLVKIGRAALTVTVGDMSVTAKTYDGTTSATIVVNSFTGKVGTDSITLTATGLFADANAGTGKTVNITGYALDAASANNYYIKTADCATKLTGEIKKKDVTAVVTAGDCVYGSVPNVTYAVTGAVAGEDIKLALTYLNGTDSTTVLKTAGTYAITAALTTEFAVNYNLTSVAPNGGAAGDPVEVEITKAPLTITVYDAEAAYGAGKVNNGAFVTGLVWSDTRASLSIADGDLTFTYGDFDTDSGAVGTYVLSIDTTALSLANYTVTVVDGAFAVGLKQLNVTITVTNGIYGGTGSDAAAVTAAADDNGTAVSVTIKYTYNGTSYDGTVYTNSTTIPVKPGEYEVIATVDTASGYTGRATSLVKIGRAALTVTVSPKTAGTTDKAEYGTAITSVAARYELKYSGWVNDDEKDSLGNPTQTGDIVPADAKWSTDYFQYAPVGTYEVVVSGLSSDNYEITYVNGTLTVEKANATVTINNQSSVYDGNVPAAANVAGVNYTVTGLKRSADDLGVSIAIANAAKDAGSYDLEASASNGNYKVTFVGETSANAATDNSGVWTIAGAYKVNKAKLTITADNKTITYGDAAPAYTATYDGFIGADGTSAGPAAGIFSTELALGCAYVQLDAASGKAGVYDILEDTAAVADNYDIIFVKGTLTVNKKAITVAIDRTKTTSQYGKTPIDFSVNTSDYYTFDTADLAQSTDDLLITLSHGVTTSSNAGAYPITAVSGNANYEVTFTDCVYTVEQYKITVEWFVDNGDGTETAITAGSTPKFEYNGANQGPKAYFNMPTGKIPATNVSGLQKNAGTGYTATVVIPDSYKGNYTFDASTSNTQSFEITARQLTITWSGDKKDDAGVFYFEFNEGIEQHPTATFGNVVSGETVAPVYVGATGLVCTSHTVEVRITDRNYSLPSNTTIKYYIVQMSLNSFYWTSDGTTNINASTYTYTYDGETHMPTAMAGVSVTFSYTLTYSDGTNCGNRAVNAGEYTVTAVPSDSNYTIPAGASNKFTFTIAPKEVKSTEVYYDTLTFEYTGADQQPMFWFTDVNGAKVYLDVTVNGAHSVADTYTAEIAAPNDKNYALTGNAANYTKQFTIAPKDIEVEWTLDGGVWTTDFTDDYTGNAITYSATAKMKSTYAGEHNKIGLKFEVVKKDSVTGASSVWTGDIRDAGVYTLRAYVSDKTLADNYNVKEYSRQITIDRLPLQISVNGGNDYTVNYNDVAPKYSADFSGFLTGEEVTVKAQVEAVENWIFSQYIRGAQPGNYPVTLTTDEDKLKAIRQILRNYDWEQTFKGVQIIVNSTTGTVLVLADNGTNEFVYDGTVKLPEAFYTPTTGNGQQRKLEVSLLAVNPDGTPNGYLTDGKAINEGTYYISVNRVSGDTDLTELITNGLYFKIIKRTVIVKISDREEDYGEVTQTNRKSHIVTEYLSSYGGRNGYLPLAADEAGLAIDVDCTFLRTDGLNNYDSQGYAQVGEYLIEGTWNSAGYGANYEVIFVGSENGVNGQFSAGVFKINKADITVISHGDAYFEEYGDFNSGDPRYVIKLADKTNGVYDNIIYSGNKRAGNTDATVTIKYVDKQLLEDAVEPKHDAEYNLTDAPRITAAGDWVVYYSIEVAGGNHNKYYGAWRVQVRPEEDFIIVIFEKEFSVPYGDGVPEDLTEQLFAGGYYRLGNNAVSKDWFKDNATAHVAGVNNASEVGLYNIYFTINDDAVTGSLVYAIKYSDSNYTPETNTGKYRIEQRLLTVSWSEEDEFVHDGETHLPELSVAGWINGGTLTPDGILANGERKYIYKDGGKEIVVTVTAEGDFKEIGGHALKVAVDNSNYRFEVKNAAKAISIKADTVIEYGHLPTWAWYVIGVGAAVLALAIIILAVKLKHRKPISEGGDDEGFYDVMSDDENV